MFQGYKCVPGGLLEQCNLPRTGWKTSPKQNDFFSPEKSDSPPDENSNQDSVILLLKAAEHLYSEQ